MAKTESGKWKRASPEEGFAEMGKKRYYTDIPEGHGISHLDKRFLTERQWEVYQFLKAYMTKFKVAPSIYDIAKAMGFTPITASIYLKIMAENGFIERPLGSRRYIILKPILDERLRPMKSRIPLAAGLSEKIKRRLAGKKAK